MAIRCLLRMTMMTFHTKIAMMTMAMPPTAVPTSMKILNQKANTVALAATMKSKISSIPT
jgi:hypothetical protein